MKKTLSAITLATVLMFGSTFANTGIIIAGYTQDTSTTTQDNTEISLTGIIIAGFTGIIIAGYTDTKDTPTGGQSNGIIIAG